MQGRDALQTVSESSGMIVQQWVEGLSPLRV